MSLFLSTTVLLSSSLPSFNVRHNVGFRRHVNFFFTRNGRISHKWGMNGGGNTLLNRGRPGSLFQLNQSVFVVPNILSRNIRLPAGGHGFGSFCPSRPSDRVSRGDFQTRDSFGICCSGLGSSLFFNNNLGLSFPSSVLLTSSTNFRFSRSLCPVLRPPSTVSHTRLSSSRRVQRSSGRNWLNTSVRPLLHGRYAVHRTRTHWEQ